MTSLNSVSAIEIQHNELIQLAKEIGIDNELYKKAFSIYWIERKETMTKLYQEYLDSLGAGVKIGNKNHLTIDMSKNAVRIRKRINAKQTETTVKPEREARRVNAKINTLGNTQPLYWHAGADGDNNPEKYSWQTPTFFSYHIISSVKGGECE